MPTVVDELITALKLTGVDQYQQQMRATTGSLEAFGAAEGTALAGLQAFGARALAGVATFETLRRGLDFVNDSFKEFAEADAISRRVGFALQQIKSKIPLSEFEQLADRLSDVTGLDDELILSQAELLSRFRLTGDQIRQLIPGIVDLAAREGKSLDTVSEAIGSALNGRVRGLQLLGVQFKRTGNDAQDFIRLLRELEKFRGAGQQLGDSPAGVLAGQQTAFGNLREAVGGRFDPAIRTFTQGGNQLLRDATRSAERGVLGRAIDFLIRPITDANESARAALRGQTLSGRLLKQFAPPSGSAADAAIDGGGGEIAQGIKAIEQNTAQTAKNTKTILRGGSDAAQGAVSIRELNQALGTR